MSQFPYVSVLTLLPFAGGFAVLLLGRAGRSAARLTAVVFATAAVAYTAMLWCSFRTCVGSHAVSGISRVGAGHWPCSTTSAPMA